MKTLYAKMPEYIHAIIAYEENGTPSIVLNERVPKTMRNYAFEQQIEFLNMETQIIRYKRYDIKAES